MYAILFSRPSRKEATAMTLILSLAAPPFVVQVADRMVTAFDTGEVVRDNAIKLVLYDNRVTFAFTGLAQLEGVTTDRWLAQTLSVPARNNLGQVCKHVTEQATRAALRPEATRLKWWKRKLAFMGVGFTRSSPVAPWLPIAILISNFHGSDWQECDYRYDFSFYYKIHDSPSNNWGWGRIGASIGNDYHRVEKFLQTCRRRNAGPGAFATVFRHAIISVADLNKAVGQDVLVAAIPCPTAVGLYPFPITGNGTFDTALFHDWPATRTRGVLTSPLFAYPGVVAGPLQMVPTRQPESSD